MYRTVITLLVTASVFFAYAIPWPVGITTAGQDSSWTLMTSYGSFHDSWELCTNPYEHVNFHFGIDIPDYSLFSGPDTVRCIRDGYITNRVGVIIPSTSDSQFVYVICDELSSDDGWCYQHLDSAYFNVSQFVTESLPLSVMERFIENPHFHFMRSERIYDSRDPGLLNPLDSLVPAASSLLGFDWLFDSDADTLFFLADMDHLDWPIHDSASVQDSVWQYLIDPDSLHGSVDLFFAYLLTGEGMKTQVFPQYSLNSQRIKWDLYGLGASSPELLDTRYVAEFSGEIGASADSTRFREHYFRWSRREWLFPLTKPGLITCLTNCGDASGWSGLGISNIEEGCWNTALALSGVGQSYNPILQDSSASDGFYSIDVTAYAWDTTDSQRVSIDCQVCNTREIAQEVVLTDASTRAEIWRAEWVAEETANGFEPVKNVLVDEPAEPGSTLEVEIVFTGPMDTSVEPFVRFSKTGGTELIAEPDSVAWTSTYLPSGYYDTWHGTVEVPSSGMSGWLTMKIKAKDNTGLGLLDPSDADPEPPATDRFEDYTDTHHGFGIAFGAEPGWSATLHGGVYGSPCLRDLDGDGDLDVVIQSKDGWINCLDDTGAQFSGWPQNGGWVPSWTKTYSSVSLSDLDQDGSLEILATNPYGCRAYELDGTYTSYLNSNYSHFSKASPAVGDLDGDDLLEIVLGRVDDGQGSAMPSVICLENDLTLKWTKLYSGLFGEMPILATPAVGDISSSHTGNEIAIATGQDFIEGYPNGETDTGYPNWVRLLDGSGNTLWTSADYLCQFWASPVVGDIDGDEINEVVIGSTTNWDDGKKVFVLNGNTGALEHTWTVGNWVLHPAALADLDDDGVLDVIVACNDHKVYAWSGDTHQALSGYPVDLGSQVGSPSVADIDGDFDLEVVVGTSVGELWALNPDGSTCTGFPVADGTYFRGSPAMGDLDGDGCLEVLIADQTDATAYCYDMGSGSFPCEMPWRQFQHDSWHSGCFEADNTVPEAPTDLVSTVTYNEYGYTADLTWDLSVNDPYSPDPEDPADVVSYQIYRAFPPSTYTILSRSHAGEGYYTDECPDPQGTVVRYVVTASDGTNESEYSNEVRFRTVPGLNLAAGCHVTEELTSRVRTSVEISAGSTGMAGIGDAGSVSTAGTATGAKLLTDGETEEVYIPGAGVRAVVIDLGCSCLVGQVDLMEADTEASASMADPSVIEVSADGTAWAALGAQRSTAGTAGRYVRISPAPITSEVFVWGNWTAEEAEESVIGMERIEGRWNLEMPVLDDASSGEIGTLSLYDVTGRVLRSWSARPGEEVDWDGRTASGMQVTPGCYFVRYEQCGEAVTRRLLVTAE